jgi:hypothetical protein
MSNCVCSSRMRMTSGANDATNFDSEKVRMRKKERKKETRIIMPVSSSVFARVTAEFSPGDSAQKKCFAKRCLREEFKSHTLAVTDRAFLFLIKI